jgi:hypothetical protein
MNTSKLIVINGMINITKKSGAIHALAFSKPAQIKPSWIQLVKMDVVRKTLKASSAGVQVNQMRQPHKTETMRNGLKLNQSMRGCMAPTKAMPNDLNTCCNPTI